MLLIKIMAGIGILAFVYILLASALGVPKHRQAGSSFLTIASNQTVMRTVQGSRVWATKFGSELLAKRQQTDSWVQQPGSGCDISKPFCLINTQTNRQGIEIRYIEQPPPQLPQSTPWFGGYINPLNSAVYDRFGRGYKINSPAASQQLPLIDIVE